MNDYITQKIAQKNVQKNNDIDYATKFNTLQQYVVFSKINELSIALKDDDFSVLRNIVEQKAIQLYGTIDEDVLDRIINDMTGYGVLNKYFADRQNIEEIDINSWDSIIIRYKNGQKFFAEECFNSPQQAREIVQRLMHTSNKHLDENTVCDVSYIGKSTRIAAAISPIIDDDIGVVASIRFVHSSVYNIPELIELGTLDEHAASMINTFLMHRVSVCVSGATNVGKTTFTAAILKELITHQQAKTRLITLEAGTRDFDNVERDKNGKVITDCVHLQTRENKNSEKLNVDLQKLLDFIMRFNPDVVAVGEMVSEEAFIAAETARTGKAVITTVHANSAMETTHRLFTLGLRKYDMKENVMMQIMTEAFPIIVYVKLYDDNIRRIQSIIEQQWIDDKIVMNELFRYKVTENIIEANGKLKVIGEFIKVNPISERLRTYLINNGATNQFITNYC